MDPIVEAAKKAFENARARAAEAGEAFLKAVTDKAAKAERNRLHADFEAREAESKEAAEEFDRVERAAKARAANPPPPDDSDPETRTGRITISGEPLTYEQYNPRSSFVLDLARDHTGLGPVADARARLRSHAEEMQIEEPVRRAKLEREMHKGLDDLLEDLPPEVREKIAEKGLAVSRGKPEARDLWRVEGKGGDTIPPVWMLDELAEFARTGRPYADAVRGIRLPEFTDSIRVPKIISGTQVGVQTQDLQTVTEVDLETATVLAPVRTIAGQQDLALQLLEQSPIGFDELVIGDLMADYSQRLEAQVWDGSGAAGQLLGVLNTAGILTVAYTDASPTLPELWPKIGDAANQVATSRKLPPSAIWQHARRWFWESSQLDANSRPFILPVANGPQNAIATFSDVVAEGGPITALHGIPTSLTQGVPIDLGSGTDEDAITVSRPQDQVLFEGDPRTRVLTEVLSGQLAVRVQVYRYVAFTAGRFPAGIAKVTGTGLVTPTF